MRALPLTVSLAALAATLLLVACPDDGDDDGDRDGGEGEAGEGEGEGGEGEGEPVDRTCRDGGFTWPVETAEVTLPPAPELWKNRLAAADDLFIHVDFDAGADETRFAKGVVLVEDPTQVYFQNINIELFHAPFAVAHLPPFAGLSIAEFNRVALREAGQEAILVTVLLPFEPGVREIGLQLAREEPYHPEQAIQILNLLQDSIDADVGTQFFYMPSATQRACAVAAADEFAAAGFPIARADRFAEGEGACYARGWAAGRLVSIDGDDDTSLEAAIDAAVASGALTAADVLLVERAPSSLPLVAGLLTLTPSTPSSSVALLARQEAIPFASILDPLEQERVRGFVGDVVLVQTEGELNACEASILDGDALPAAERARLVAARPSPSPAIAPTASAGAVVVDVAGLDADDLGAVGAAAVQHALFLEALAQQAPDAAVVTADVFAGYFADDVVAAAVDEAVAAVGDGSDVVAATTALAALRQSLLDTPLPDGDAVVAALAARFAPTDTLLLRPSLNADDFARAGGSGAAVRACLADDLDDDDDGPSACDAAVSAEQGVLQALPALYVTLWSPDAVLDRRRRAVADDAIVMGVLVVAAVGEDDVVANGVALVNGDASGFVGLEVFAQQGALPVSAVEATPERLRVDVFSSATFVTPLASSSFLPAGATLLAHDPNTGEGDYATLGALVQDIAAARSPRLDDDDGFQLVVSFVRDADGFVFTDLRELPQQDRQAIIPVALLSPSTTLCPFEGEAGDVFANHRAKSRIRIAMDGRVVDAPGSRDPIFQSVDIDLVVASAFGSAIVNVADDFVDLLDSSYRSDGESVSHGFRTDDRRIEIVARDTAPRRLIDAPFLAYDGTRPELVIRYDAPVAFMGFDDTGSFGVHTRTEEQALLVACTLDDATVPGESRVERSYASTDGAITVDATWFWPPGPSGISAGYTAPTVRWGATTIRGLIDDDIVLDSPWSQTSRPQHHNFGEDLIFEPRLEPGIDAAIVAALDAIDVAALYLADGRGFFAIGLDGTIRSIGGSTLP